ncbi:MAG: hypothetical protein HKO57_17485, partial [Akkermansiaceae bacterium]|nr:hypothetical protein [Akkermansiaceae bacterium]
MPDSSHPIAEADAFTAPLIEKLNRHPKRIVFSEGEDPRILRVAAEMNRLGAGSPILLGNHDRIEALGRELGIEMGRINAHDPAESTDLPMFCDRLRQMQRYRGIELSNACEVLAQPAYFAAMMIQHGQADGMVAGNQSLPPAVFRPLLQLVQPLRHVPRVFSTVVQVAPQLPHFGRDGILFMADCGLNPEPPVDDLAAIAVETGLLARHYLGRRVRVALLSHSTMGSSTAGAAPKMKAATELARQHAAARGADIEIDGELQVDVALDPDAAEIKLPGADRKQPADVLIFPSLDAAHISFKLLKHAAGVRTYGQLVQGLARPA